jgi:hypothetical protein
MIVALNKDGIEIKTGQVWALTPEFCNICSYVVGVNFNGEPVIERLSGWLGDELGVIKNPTTSDYFGRIMTPEEVESKFPKVS